MTAQTVPTTGIDLGYIETPTVIHGANGPFVRRQIQQLYGGDPLNDVVASLIAAGQGLEDPRIEASLDMHGDRIDLTVYGRPTRTDQETSDV